MAEARVLPFRPRPEKPKQLVSSGVAGMVLFVFTEVMVFTGFISAHVIVKSRAPGSVWPPPGQPRLPFESTAFNTTALLLSGVILLAAHLAYQKGAKIIEGRLALATILGGLFVALQGREWAALIGEGLTLTSSPYGAFFYVIVGAHALHAIGALAALVWAWLRLRDGSLTKERLSTVALFWYFVVLVWPVLYLQVYL
ncbi:MAG: cytochrome c oxidase subunit 3 [Longimicrobiales bacterium]